MHVYCWIVEPSLPVCLKNEKTKTKTIKHTLFKLA